LFKLATFLLYLFDKGEETKELRNRKWNKKRENGAEPWQMPRQESAVTKNEKKKRKKKAMTKEKERIAARRCFEDWLSRF
jgi:hypothetical protein